MSPLSNEARKLVHTRSYVDGHWVAGVAGRSFCVVNPANGETVTEVCDLGAAETEDAILAASRAQAGWARRTGKERAGTLWRWFELIRDRSAALAEILTLEQGKPLAEAMGEVGFGASYVQWYAEEAKRTDGSVIPGYLADRRTLVIKQPVGVVAAITPWNFPSAMMLRKCAPALAAGCTVVLKPAEQTPLSALALAALSEEAGLPPGVLNVVCSSDPAAVGAALTMSPLVRKVSFTGSTEVGKLLMRQCADTVKKITLELGGHAPFIVFDDADLDAAVAGAMASKFRTSGQTCVCANRIFVQRNVYDEFARLLCDAVRGLRVGNGFEEGIDQGPLINAEAVAKVEHHVADAVSKGARVLTGGSRDCAGDHYYCPTVLSDVAPGMVVMEEETFGPVAPLIAFDTEEQVIGMANDSRYGLAAYLFTTDLGRVIRVCEALEVGSVGVNTGIMSTETAPAGGVKESGMGREGSRAGIEDYLELKYICLAGIERRDEA